MDYIVINESHKQRILVDEIAAAEAEHYRASLANELSKGDGSTVSGIEDTIAFLKGKLDEIGQ